ncbi:MAG: ATP-binding cassette domain-containing protein [Planctomycetales bacterium]|nr:ATP-binding cassette domain-containing protein [Planctomycetales bacterium]
MIGPFRWFLGLARPYRGGLAGAFAALVVSGGVSLLLPAVAGSVVDAAIVEKSLERLETVILAMIGLFAVSGALSFVEHYTLRAVAARLLRDLRVRLHGHLLGLSMGFFESQRVGDLLSRLNADVETLGSLLTDHLLSGTQQALMLLGAVAILVAVHPALTGVMLLAVPPVVVAAVLFGMRLEKLSKRRQEAVAEANVAAEESLAGIRTVQAFAREPLERERYGARQESAVAVALRAARAWGAFGGVVSFLAFSALTLVLWRGGTLVIREELTAGQLTSFLLYTATVASAVGSLTAFYGSVRQAAGATDRVRKLLETPAGVADGPDARPMASRPRGHVTFREVRFRYPSADGRAAVDGVTLEIAPGTCLALVGPSGAGKTTLVSLLLRFHDPQEGAVLVDGEDARRLRLGDLRASIGLVPQEIFLFGGTVAENIRYGRPAASDAEVRVAADAAQAHGFISALPKGYETLVGERGVKLSAGERQRIAIARVLLKDPPIVVLDEATSALDSESERLVQLAFEKLLAGRTTLVIAHRLATVRRADRVAVLKAGAVVEEGTHESLLARGGLYRHLCELQMLDAAGEPAGRG